jgi:hypothetical protein
LKAYGLGFCERLREAGELSLEPLFQLLFIA